MVAGAGAARRAAAPVEDAAQVDQLIRGEQPAELFGHSGLNLLTEKKEEPRRSVSAPDIASTPSPWREACRAPCSVMSPTASAVRYTIQIYIISKRPVQILQWPWFFKRSGRDDKTCGTCPSRPILTCLPSFHGLYR